MTQQSGASSTGGIDIGSRLEPLIDDYLIDRMDGARLALHHPVPREVAIFHDAPWEGNTCCYHSVFQDGDVYRMYYRGSDLEATQEVTCYAESSDGVRWEKPELGLFDFKGSKKNNIVWADLHGSHNLMPFKDMNPAAADSERYKAVAGTKDYGFYGFSSPDGLRWKRVQPEPFFPDDRSTDWISSGFWDRHQGQYLAYHRAWDSDHGEVMDLRVPAPGEQPQPSGRMNVANRWRSVRYCSSADSVHWTDTRLCQFDPPLSLDEQLYTNAVQPYFRAPHIYIGMPKRFAPFRHKILEHEPGVSDGGFMTSRDGVHWKLWREAFIRPGLDSQNWVNRNNMPAFGMLETAPGEISVYWRQHSKGDVCRLRRGTVRTDGFVSVNAGYGGGELVTKPLTFSGRELAINYSTSAFGSVQVELQDAAGSVLDGYSLAQCPVIYGDAIEHKVSWDGGADVSGLAGNAVRLRFALKDADLYSLRFAHGFNEAR